MIQMWVPSGFVTLNVTHQNKIRKAKLVHWRGERVNPFFFVFLHLEILHIQANSCVKIR